MASIAVDEACRELHRVITTERCKALLIDLVRVPSPQTPLMESEPLLRQFVEKAVLPRLQAIGFVDIRSDTMGNICSAYGENRSGRSLMLITNAMNQPQATMANAYAGDVADGAPYGLPGEVVFGKGASEQKATMAAMLLAMEAVMASGVPISGQLVHLCCLSGETGKHDAISSIIESTGARADMAFLGGTSLEIESRQPRPHRCAHRHSRSSGAFQQPAERLQCRHRCDGSHPSSYGDRDEGQR